jgi:hypothetical protein
MAVGICGWSFPPAWTAAEEALARLRKPSAGDASSSLLTVGDWLFHWIATRNRASSTVRGYISHVRLQLSPYLGKPHQIRERKQAWVRAVQLHEAQRVPFTATNSVPTWSGLGAGWTRDRMAVKPRSGRVSAHAWVRRLIGTARPGGR